MFSSIGTVQRNLVKYIIFMPGYIYLWVKYYFPIETSNRKVKRNVATSRRQWKEKDKFAILYSAYFYALVFLWYWVNYLK